MVPDLYELFEECSRSRSGKAVYGLLEGGSRLVLVLTRPAVLRGSGQQCENQERGSGQLVTCTWLCVTILSPLVRVCQLPAARPRVGCPGSIYWWIEQGTRQHLRFEERIIGTS